MKTAFVTVVMALLLSLVPASALISEGGGGIIYGENYAFNVNAPKGWIFDNESGVQQGMYCAFYPKGATWEDSAVIAYARARNRAAEVKTADDAAKVTIDEFRAEGNPKYDGKRAKTITTKKGVEGVIYHFTGDRYGNYEAIVFFLEAKTINVVILNSRNRKAFEEALPAFEQIAESYVFLGDAPLKNAPVKKKAK